jgi:uncharacterized oligopeptide transporter (OPT) family protein
MSTVPITQTGLKRFLPPIGSPGYHVMLACVAIFILGPLGGISAAFMNFSIGFFIGGQVLAGILGSTVTLPYGPEGKHGANYMQTMAASVAGMCGMAVLVQAMSWLGLPEPAAWKLVLYFMCIGMFGVGLGMLYTPILVDKMQLAFPSGYAVANILRALTDKNLLKRSIAKLGGGMLGGFVGGLGASQIPAIEALGLSTSTFGAGMIVGSRIAIPALVVGLIGDWMKPYLISIGWLESGAPFRKIGFIIALGTILGAAIVDIGLILIQAIQRLRQKNAEPVAPAEDWKRVNNFRLVLWILFWGAGLVVVGSQVLHQPVFFLVVAVLLSFLFVLVNGISLGISDSNPISSAFVMTVFILASVGLKDPGVGLMCASILLIACSEGGDMQQDRSTGWRLGTSRIVQFRYQVIGIAMGAVLAVTLAKVFMSAYPVLKVDQFGHHVEGAQRWQSAMTYKFVGALRGITNAKGYVMTALRLGIAIGLATEVMRKLLKANAAYKRFVQKGRTGFATDFLVDAVVLPSPYASSFGGFVELNTLYWWAGGGTLSSLFDTWQERRKAREPRPANGEVPSDMSTMSLIGGGLIAGDSLAALSVGVYGLLMTVL